MNSLNSNRWISIVGYISSVLTIIQSIISMALIYHNQQQADGIYPFWQQMAAYIALILCVVTLCVLLFNSQLKNEKIGQEIKSYNEKEKTFDETLRGKDDIIVSLCLYNHNINHQNRQMLFELYNKLYEKTTKAEIEIIDNKFRGYLQNFTTNVKTAFDSFTMDKSCAVYITFLREENESILAQTGYRDPTSYTLRNNIDMQMPVYSAELFTPFKHLLDSRNNDSYFACDNCKEYPNFCDRNDDWNSYYNSCLTVPIRVRIDKTNNIHNCLGFLTVDNKYGNLNNKDAITLLCSYADTLYMNIAILMDLKNMSQKQK